MRKILVKWLIKLALACRLKSETIHICVQLVDCVLIRNPALITKQNFQLLGVTSLFMASKLSEIFTPDVKKFVNACGGIYTVEDLFKMEEQVLLVMDFNLQFPTICQFVGILTEDELGLFTIEFLESSLANPNQEKEVKNLMKSLADLSLLDF